MVQETEEGIIVQQEKNYYPFGLTHKGYNFAVNGRKHNYGYNGIELNEDVGLYEMDLRQYDPAIARWTAIDPVTHHSNSTYNGFDNNPVFWADPSGADVEQINGGTRYTGVHAQAAFGALQKQYGNSSGNNSDNNKYKEFFNSKVKQYDGVLAELDSGSSNEWQPLTNQALKDYVANTVCTGCSEGKLNQVSGDMFEDSFHRFAELNFSSEGYVRAPRKTSSSVPDGYSNVTHYNLRGFSRIFPRHAFWEVKGRSKNVTLDKQIRGFIDQLARLDPTGQANKFGALSLSFVTTSNSSVGWDVYNYASKGDVTVYHWQARYKKVMGSMMVDFGVRHVMSWVTGPAYGGVPVRF